MPAADEVIDTSSWPTRTAVALLPGSVVVPTVKVLPVDGADLFGGADARADALPVHRDASSWPSSRRVGAVRRGRIRTMISPGNMCPDRGPAHAAITLGRGWDWVFGGGTAEYTAFNRTRPAGFVGNGFNIVEPSDRQRGCHGRARRGGDVTIAEIECPFVDDFTVNKGTIFSLDPAMVPLIRDTYGVDVVIFAANHPFDHGVEGFVETLEQFAANGLPTTGAGAEPRGGAHPGDRGGQRADLRLRRPQRDPRPDPGRPRISPACSGSRDEHHVTEAVRRAREVADVVICVPQWWGGEEYHCDWSSATAAQQQVYFDAGCDHVLGQGTH